MTFQQKKLDVGETWFISDSHFHHSRIVEYENRPLNHEDLMWEGLSLVQKEDTLVHVGDIGFGNKSTIVEVLERLPGRRRVLIEGNHDKRNKKIRNWEGWYEVHRFKEVWTVSMRGIRLAISHRPQELYQTTNCADAYIHGHVHGKKPRFRREPCHTFSSVTFHLNEDNRLYVNACVEVNDYKPISLTKIKEECGL